MPKEKMSHDQARQLVCCVCTNLRGSKAIRAVSDAEEKVVRDKVYSGYDSSSDYFPSGICKACIFFIKKLMNETEAGITVNLVLPEDYNCQLPRATRTTSVPTCNCRWCDLGRMNGPKFKQWQMEVKGRQDKNKIERLCATCFVGIQRNSKHTCCPSKVEAVQNLVATLSGNLKWSLALEILQEETSHSGDHSVSLTPARGGHNVVVTLGLSPSPPPLEPLSHEEVIVMATNAHLTGAQTTSIMVDIRNKYGKKVVESHLKPIIALNNTRLAQFFKNKGLPLL